MSPEQRRKKRLRDLKHWHLKAAPRYRYHYRALLRDILGVTCHWCSAPSVVIDHVVPRTWDPAQLGRPQRLARYTADVMAGQCVASCEHCNEVRGGLVRNGWPFDVHPADALF